MLGRVMLYVEDEDAAFLLFQIALKTVNIEVDLHRASDGEQALKYLHRSAQDRQLPKPDLVLLDLNLPRKNGFDVLNEIKTDSDLRAISVIVFSSSSLTSDKRRSMALGATDYITKPFTYDGLVEAVKTACSYLPA